MAEDRRCRCRERSRSEKSFSDRGRSRQSRSRSVWRVRHVLDVVALGKTVFDLLKIDQVRLSVTVRVESVLTLGANMLRRDLGFVEVVIAGDIVPAGSY